MICSCYPSDFELRYVYNYLPGRIEHLQTSFKLVIYIKMSLLLNLYSTVSKLVTQLRHVQSNIRLLAHLMHGKHKRVMAD